ncbi:MAG: choice-of-anchor J domain-containing protein [Flavobacteriaceae bacterium]
MKTNKFLNLLIFIAFISASVSCVEDGDFTVPAGTNIQEPVLTGTETTFSAVYSAYQQALANGDNSVTFDQDIYITGYVISSDQAGNFFEEIIIQNKVDDSNPVADPRLGLKVEINVPSLYTTYQTGRKVYIKLNGLSAGLSNGVMTIGKGTSIDQIQPFEYQDFVLRSSEVATITPKVSPIGNLTSADLNTLIQLDNMQFYRDQIGLTYAGEASDQFDGFRTLESCDDNATISLQSSTFSDFKSITISQNKGAIQGIFSRDFGDDFNVFIINSLSDINFDDVNRCDPPELNCGTAAAEGANTLFEDDFETQATFSLISGNGWTNHIQEGTEGWEAYTATGSNASLGISARVGSFRSGDTSTVSWLITPPIDFDAQDGETLTFQTSNSFADGSTMDVLFSTDWDGTTAGITAATWGILPAAYVTQDSDSFASWFSSGIVDLSCATGTVYIAFKYTGSGDSGFDGTYELDEIKIKSN